LLLSSGSETDPVAPLAGFAPGFLFILYNRRMRRLLFVLIFFAGVLFIMACMADVQAIAEIMQRGDWRFVLLAAAIVTLAYRGFTFWIPLLVGMVSFRMIESMYQVTQRVEDEYLDLQPLQE
jgi:uncharacterized membrane protein YbhN (UPF0104 family)